MDWLEQTDDAGNLYYYNLKTGESSWEAPEGYVKLEVRDGWVEQQDEEGNIYYYNVNSGESSWEAPPAFQPPPTETEEEPYEEERVGDNQEIEGDPVTDKVQEKSEDLPKWSKIYDSSHGAFYYHDNVTGECQWELPEDYIEPEEGQEVRLPPKLQAAIKIQSILRGKLARLKLNDAGEVQDVGDNELEDQSGQVNPARTDEELEADSDGAEAAVRIQSVVRAQQARKSVRSVRGRVKAAGEDSHEEWILVVDPSSGEEYYYNKRTNESSWDKPAELTANVDEITSNPAQSEKKDNQGEEQPPENDKVDEEQKVETQLIQDQDQVGGVDNMDHTEAGDELGQNKAAMNEPDREKDELKTVLEITGEDKQIVSSGDKTLTSTTEASGENTSDPADAQGSVDEEGIAPKAASNRGEASEAVTIAPEESASVSSANAEVLVENSNAPMEGSNGGAEDETALPTQYDSQHESEEIPYVGAGAEQPLNTFSTGVEASENETQIAAEENDVEPLLEGEEEKLNNPAQDVNTVENLNPGDTLAESDDTKIEFGVSEVEEASEMIPLSNSPEEFSEHPVDSQEDDEAKAHQPTGSSPSKHHESLSDLFGQVEPNLVNLGDSPVEAEAECLPEWVQLYDSQTRNYYYFNNHTDEWQWEQPEPFAAGPPDFLQLQSSLNPKSYAALIFQTAFRAHLARALVAKKRESGGTMETVGEDSEPINFHVDATEDEEEGIEAIAEEEARRAAAVVIQCAVRSGQARIEVARRKVEAKEHISTTATAADLAAGSGSKLISADESTDGSKSGAVSQSETESNHVKSAAISESTYSSDSKPGTEHVEAGPTSASESISGPDSQPEAASFSETKPGSNLDSKSTEESHPSSSSEWSIAFERERVAKRLEAKRIKKAAEKAAEEQRIKQEKQELLDRRVEIEKERRLRKEQRREETLQRIERKREILQKSKTSLESNGSNGDNLPLSKSPELQSSIAKTPVHRPEAEAYRRRPTQWPLPAVERFSSLAQSIALKSNPAADIPTKQTGSSSGDQPGSIPESNGNPRKVDNVYKRSTALHIAVVEISGNEAEKVRKFVEEGAELHARDFSGDTPLHCAARVGNFEAVKALLEADQPLLRTVMMRNNKQRTPLEVAAVHFMKRIVSNDSSFQAKEMLGLLSTATMERIRIQPSDPTPDLDESSIPKEAKAERDRIRAKVIKGLLQ